MSAEWVVLSEDFRILASCCLSPMSKNLVLEKLNKKHLTAYIKHKCTQHFAAPTATHYCILLYSYARCAKSHLIQINAT